MERNERNYEGNDMDMIWKCPFGNYVYNLEIAREQGYTFGDLLEIFAKMQDETDTKYYLFHEPTKGFLNPDLPIEKTGFLSGESILLIPVTNAH